MARMIPSEYNDSTNSNAEIFIYNQIQKSFDENWIIFHS